LHINLKKKLFRIVEYLRKEPVFKSLKELEQNQKMTYEEMKGLELLKLKKILKHAYENVPFYRKQFDLYGVSLKRIKRIDDIKIIPILSKDILKRNISHLTSNKRITLYPAKTSGSTGQPLKFYRDRIATSYAYAAMFRGLRWHGVDLCDSEAYLWGIPIGRRDYYNARVRDFILNRFREKKFNLSDEVNQDFYDRMVRKNPRILSGYGSLIYEFAKYIQNKRLNSRQLHLKLVKYTAEMMFDYQRKFVSELFSCPVVSEYGSAETGIVAFQCPDGKYHVMNDCVCLEFEKDHFTGYYKIIITNLNSYSFPLIRYDTGDLVRSNHLTKCTCGLPFPVMDEIIGRSSDVVMAPDGKRIHSNIFSYIIKELIKKYDNIKQLRFIQTKLDELKVEMLTSLVENELLKVDIANLIHERISSKLRVTFDENYKNERTDTGKLRYFISELKNKE
jgi:phenylacetate-CoA ligase